MIRFCLLNTPTYSRLYDKEANICYIHGEAKEGEEENNMVLGYDDSYMNEEVVAELTPFEKYYQRIVKSTDNSYIDWLNQMKKTYNYVHVFGHSLSPSDGDVLRQFFEANETHTTIYYIDDEDKAKKISNLALILGREKLIELAGGISPRIAFEII